MKITLARAGASALAVVLASLAALGRAQRPATRDPGGAHEVISYDALVFADHWLAKPRADSTRRELG
jgi:hypothetical protein